MLSTIKRRAMRYARAAGVPGTLNAKAIFQDGSEKERTAFYRAGIARNHEGYRARVAFKDTLEGDKGQHGVVLPEISHDNGIMLVRPEGLAVLDEALVEAREAFKGYVPGTNKRDRDSLQGVPRANRTHTSAINRLATHPEVLRVVSNYMGMLPVLYRINVLYSPNDEVVEASSQFFHLDPEDVIMTKIFVFVEDVDVDTGPTTALPADKSALVRRAIDYRKGRVEDSVVEKYGGKENLVQATGPSGTLAFLDTCRCFHMGSRIASKPRYAIMIQYQTPYAASFELDGPLPTTPLGPIAVPPAPTPLDEYLHGLKR
ncbi:MAG: hypothetical protein IT305_28350 [Chloroflexi bacterium]|nr:hypothetical protein [Chloroflexota bacterium]